MILQHHERLEKGVYRYLSVEDKLAEISRPDSLERLTARAALSQVFAGAGAAAFIWTAIPCRMEWRYGDAAYKVIALDAGHVCQGLFHRQARPGEGRFAGGS
ncbi:MAG: hypothetical protein Q7I97_08365 [Thermovirgaceae bacterium]|nr:hypothetical protein [Thermovirgaceae bacterium]